MLLLASVQRTENADSRKSVFYFRATFAYESALSPENKKNCKHMFAVCRQLSILGGENEIRTRGTDYSVRRFSKPVVSAT
ncbi:MAG: hypothetical protein K2L04_08155, partial [Alistipes sp.]|nr:hypothetical protein [Alistipes sp.]